MRVNRENNWNLLASTQIGSISFNRDGRIKRTRRAKNCFRRALTFIFCLERNLLTLLNEILLFVLLDFAVIIKIYGLLFFFVVCALSWMLVDFCYFGLLEFLFVCLFIELFKNELLQQQKLNIILLMGQWNFNFMLLMLLMLIILIIIII